MGSRTICISLPNILLFLAYIPLPSSKTRMWKVITIFSNFPARDEELDPWLLSRQASNSHLTSPSAISLYVASFTQSPQRRRGFDGSLSLPPRVICAPGTGIDLQTISNWPIWSVLTCPMSVLDPFTYVADWSGVLFFFSNVIPWRMVPTTW
jgi:hypothetical protein